MNHQALFKREVQPVLDKFCVGCHKEGAQPVNGQAVADFTAKKENGERNFTKSYIALHPFVRRPGPESDYHLLKPLEYHAYLDSDGRNNLKTDVMKTVRGGSWFDRPIHTSAAARLPYRAWQAVYNVGFRVVMSANGQPIITATGAGQPATAVSTR
jgi:hypothetical protein